MLKLPNLPKLRELALECLLQKAGNTPFPVLLEKAFAQIPAHGHSSQDRACLMALCYGVLRNAGLLKQICLSHCKKKPGPAMETCLCLALFEIFFMNKSEYAVVNEYANLIKKREGQSKAHAVNAILRTILKNKNTAAENLAHYQEQIKTKIPDNRIPNKKALRKLHQLADLSELFTNNIHKSLYQLLAEESFYAPIPSFRLNPQKNELPQHAELFSQSIVFFPEQKTQERAQEQILPLAKQGILSRQGVSSALFAEKIAAFIQEKNLGTAPLWDMCCGRGGKSLALLEKNIRVSMVSEPNSERLEAFKTQLSRLGLPSPQIMEGLAEKMAQDRKFPLILLDSPCSTSGTIARNPEVKYRISEESLAEISLIQEKLLRLASEHLEDKGCLFYCTCSVFECENKEQIKKLLAEVPAMHCLHEEYLVPSRLNPAFKGHDILYFAILQKE